MRKRILIIIMMAGGKRKKQQCCILVYVLELPDCLNLHYFVYFVTDYIDGIEYCT